MRTLGLLSILLLLLCGCTSGRTFNGTWTSSMRIMDQNADCKFTFNPDGSYRSEVTLPSGFNNQPMTVIGTGKYKSDDWEKLEVTVEDVDVDGVLPGVADGVRRRASREFKKSQKFAVQWINDDKITIAPIDGQPLQLKRHK